ncbi:heterokaryon incompatibility protein-domain-containing protein [Nemania sp. FL0031]|nr:heterokaryon incompatibility protein-domain-containing protein [Nemania sp. FL0031]
MSFNLKKLTALDLHNWTWVQKEYEDLRGNLPTDVQSLCPCQRRRRGFPITFTEIHNAATNSSCRMCAIFEQVVIAVVDGKVQDLFEGLEDQSQRAEILKNVVVGAEQQPHDQQERYLEFLIKGRSDRLEARLFQDNEDRATIAVRGFTFPTHSRFETNTNSELGFRWAGTQLTQCLTQHKCGQQALDQFPKRMLSIQGDQVKLLDATGSESPYVALSHRWGGPEHRRLISTVATIRNHKNGIPWINITKTFQDAITTCRRMGVNYLWIDTLCILQQCSGLTEAQVVATQEDFAEENSKMASIYRGSYFTISADISTNMDSGIFGTDIPPKCVPLKVTSDDGNEATVYVRSRWIHHPREKLDIETRGWTFQEFLLPPRVLHFGNFDITWRCQETHVCQCGQITGMDDGAHSWRERLAKATRPIPQKPSEAQEWWATVLTFYQIRKLSKDSDKLPALSGIASIYAAATDDTYKAGLWGRSLLHDLCWYNYWDYDDRRPLLVGKRPAHPRAPSWSWASIDTLYGVTSYFWSPGVHGLHPITPSGNQRPVSTIYDVICPPKIFGTKFDATGEVDDSSIEIGVELIPATLELVVNDMIPWTVACIDDGTHVQWCMPDCEMGDDGLKEGDKVYCAPIQESLTEASSERGCLVLKHLRDQEYQRVGFCVLTMRNPNMNDEQYDNFERWGFHEPLDLNSSEIASKIQDYALHFDPNAACRITIV